MYYQNYAGVQAGCHQGVWSHSQIPGQEPAPGRGGTSADCIASNNGGGISAESDEILSIAINAAVHSSAPETKQMLDRLIKRIGSVELRISSHIYIGQLKSAYLLANKHERLGDIRRILRQAELTGQVHIKRLCEMKLQLSAPQPPL